MQAMSVSSLVQPCL